jgi:hypothetical protein
MNQRAGNFASACLRWLSRAALRILITGLIFTACLLVATRYLGLPLPGPSELLDKLKGVTQLSEVLS